MESDSYKPVNSEENKKLDENAEVEPADDVNEEDEAKMSLTGNDRGSATKIQFTNSNQDDLKDGKKDPVITIQDLKAEFSGMNKEELMKYVNDPFWIRLRWVLFILFWIGWIAMIVGAVVIVVLAPRCAPPPEREWWQKGTMYQLYVRSFKDFSGDGNGDLQGIIQKLDYVKDLGVNTIILSPFYQSSNVDGGYDVTDYLKVNELHGNMSDFDDLMKEINSRDLHLILDFVPNHSGSGHKWFEISNDVNHPEHDKYKDYYVWADRNPSTRQEPNNWRNVHYGSAWEWSNARNQYYLHQFLPSQPDLNLRNPEVKKELTNVLKFWLDKGVHGFRVDAVTHLFEDAKLQDEEKNPLSESTDENEYDYWWHNKTQFQPETFELLGEWRKLLDGYGSGEEKRIMITESYEPSDMLVSFYHNGNSSLADIPTNMDLLSLNSDVTGFSLSDSIQTYLDSLDDTQWPNWQVGNHDTDRVGSRLGGGMIDLMNMLIMFLKGTPLTYYGEEIGMTNTPVKIDQIVDGAANFIGKSRGGDARMKATRDPSRTPMQWNSSENVGFTNGPKTWLPVNINKNLTNVKDESKSKKSRLQLYKNLIKLREEPALLYGNVEFPHVDGLVFSALRFQKGVPGYLLVMNVGDNSTTVDFSGKSMLPDSGIVHLSSTNLVDGDFASKGKKVDLDKVTLNPKQGVIFTFIPKSQ